MLTPDEVSATVRDLWRRHQDEIGDHDRVYDYLRGRRGFPDVPDGSGEELIDLSRMSVKNILPLVVDAFAQAASVVGFRSPSAVDNADVWALWQLRRLDARQSEVHRAAITYGSAYVVAASGEARIRSPRQMIAVYADPHVDLWPIYALETWIDRSGVKPVRKGVLCDEDTFYPVSLGGAGLRRRAGDEERGRFGITLTYEEADAEPHGADHCPVVRFVNSRDVEDVVVGEVSPLITQQRAINAVNFDRLVVSRFGAFPQKYAIGWSASGPAELARVSASRLMAFDDETVKVGDFAQASVDGYNSILEEMIQHAAMTAQIPPFALTGDVLNIAAEAAAMIDAPYQRKSAGKRESFGESWEQYLRLDGALHGIEVPDDAEVIWADAGARSFGAVVDGIVKLVASGVPIDELLPDIPGWTQQRVDSARAALRRSAGRGVIDALVKAAEPPVGP